MTVTEAATPWEVRGSVGTHASRTIMFTELELLLSAVPAGAEVATYHHAIVEDNVLLKKTDSTRKKSFRHLRELYLLESEHPLFAALRALWQADPPSRPILALLTALARDRFLRATAPFIVATPEHAPVGAEALAQVVKEAYPQRLSELTLHKVGRNTAASWTQSGHVTGHTTKTRAKVGATPATCAYAMWLGFLEGQRGLRLFETLWTDILDTSLQELDALAFTASQRGWLEYKRLADVAEFGFGQFEGFGHVAS